MKSRIQVILSIIALIYIGASFSIAQPVAGDYGSLGTGNWGTTGANWLVFVSDPTWNDATPALAAPTTSTNVWIRSGHTVTMEASSKTCKKLTVQSGGTLLTSAASYSLAINGNAQIDGTLGSASAGPVVQFNISGTISGAGTLYFSKIRPNANGDTITVDMNVTGYNATGNFINCNNKTPFTLVLNPGRSITLPTGGYISTQSNSATSDPGTGANVTYNIYGAINAPVSTGGGISLANLPGFTTTLNVFNGAVINTGRLSAVAAGTADAGALKVNVQSGGTLNLIGAVSNDMTKATIAVDGTFDCDSSTSTTFGTATVSSTGKIRLSNAAFPTGAVTLNSGSTVEYYGSSGFTLPSSPTAYRNLQINNASVDTLGAGITVNETLTLSNGTLSIGANTLTLNGAISTSGGSLTGGATSNMTVSGTGASTVLPAITLNNLTLDRSSGVTLSGNVMIGGVLTLTNGTLGSGSYTLAVASGGSVSRTNGYVIGTLQKYLNTGSNVVASFELGTANGYSPVSITFTNITSAGNFSGSIVAGDPSNIATSGIDQTKNVNQYWLFSGPAVFDSYSGTLNFASGDIDGGATPSNFVARAYNGNMWSPLTVGTKTATSTQISGTASAGGIIALGEKVSTTIKITASAGPNGSISPSGESVLSYGSSQSFTITPASFYHVDSVIVDGVKVDSTTSYTFINAVSDHTIRAVFAAVKLHIDASAGPNGSINPSGVVPVDSGGIQLFTFTPNTGYHVDSVIVDGAKVDSVARYTFNNIIVNHTIRITFAINQYTITVISGANGTITPSGPVTVNYGVTQAFSVVPNAHYHVDSLLVDGTKVDSTVSYTFVNISANHTIRAVFTIDQLAITATASTGGTISPSGTVIASYGGSQVFTFSTNVHYQMDSVIVDGVKVDSIARYTFSNITTSHTIRVTFAAIVMSIKSNGTGGGGWNDVSTWQGGFVPILSDTVTILAKDSVVVVGKASCKTINVLASGKLFLLSSDTLTVTSLDSASVINGTIVNAGLITVSGKLQFGTGAKYQHTRNGGSIPLSLWGTGSTCEITGVTANAPSNGNQNFYNITWNCPGQTTNLNMGWNGNTIGGNITIDSTGSSRWQMCAPTAGTDSAHVTTSIVTIIGNIIQTGGQFSSNGTGNGFTAVTINTMGNITVTGGNFSVSRGSQGGNGTTTWNVYGNFSMSRCTTQNSNPAGAKFVFAKAGVQSLVLGPGNTLTSLPIEVKTGATLNIDTCVLAGSGIFKLDSAATLLTARPNGLNGNLTNTDTLITLSPYANFIYAGAVPQVTGTLLPANIHRLTVNNNAGVTLSDTVSISDTLFFSAGKLTLAGNVLIAKGVSGSSSTKYVVTSGIGTLTLPSIGAAEVLLPIGTASAYAPVWITNSGTADAFSVGVVPDTIAAKLGGRVKVKWTIVEGVSGGSNCTLKFGWMSVLEDAIFAVNRAANAGIFQFGTDTSEDGTGAYTSQFVSEPFTISRGGIKSFGSFAVGKFGVITSVGKIDQVPHVFMLSQNYPNPFNPTTTIEFTVPKDGIAKLTVYNLLGQKVATLFDGEARVGTVHRALFNASNLASGVYFSRLEFGDQKMTRRLLLMK